MNTLYNIYIYVYILLSDDAEQVVVAIQVELLAVHGDLGAAVFGEQDVVARLDGERDNGAVVGATAGADGDDGALVELGECAFGEKDSARTCLLGGALFD